MIGLLQRVTSAEVSIAGVCIGRIGPGLAVLIGVCRGDGVAQGERLLERLLGYRVFPDAQGRMNLCLREVGGGLLLVPQFTLAADTRHGMRPGFSRAAPPGIAEERFNALVAAARATHPLVGAGQFGARMQLSLTNDGPVTFWIETPTGEP